MASKTPSSVVHLGEFYDEEGNTYHAAKAIGRHPRFRAQKAWILGMGVSREQSRANARESFRRAIASIEAKHPVSARLLASDDANHDVLPG